MYTITDRPTEDAKMIRQQVFVDEQHFEDEFDELDGRSRHIVLYIKNKPAATCRYYPCGEKGKYILGRMAVLPEYRGQQVGKKVMEKAEKAIADDGGCSVSLSAQVQASGFYQKCGYIPCGETFLEQGCPHIQMEKRLTVSVQS